MAWQFDRPEAGEGIVQAFRRRESPQNSVTFKLRGVDPEARYIVTDLEVKRPRRVKGGELLAHGLTIHLAKQPGAAVMTYKRSKSWRGASRAAPRRCF